MSQESRFCHRCGASLPVGSSFCPRCGTPVGVAPSASSILPSGPNPARERRHEKQEKQEKNEKSEKNEKGRGGDLAAAVTGGLVLILLGLLLYWSETGTTAITWSNFWEYFILGLGAILIVQGLVRYAQRGHLIPGTFIGGAVLMVIGGSFVASSDFGLWPLILIVLGVGAIASAFVGRRGSPVP